MANPNLRFFDSESNDLNLLYNSDTNIEDPNLNVFKSSPTPLTVIC